VKFDSVRRNPCLAVQKIKHANAFDLHRDVGGLKAGVAVNLASNSEREF